MIKPMDYEGAFRVLLGAIDDHPSRLSIMDDAGLHIEHDEPYNIDDVSVCSYCDESKITAQKREFDGQDRNWCDGCLSDAERWYEDEMQYEEEARLIR